MRRPLQPAPERAQPSAHSALGVARGFQRVFACLLLASGAVGCSERTVQASPQQRPALPQVSASAPLVGLPDPMPRGDSFRRGVVLGPLTAPADAQEEAAFKREHVAQLDRAVALGATDLQLIIHWRQASESAVEIFPYDSIHDDLLTWLLDQAKRRKLRTWLSPVLTIEDGAIDRTKPAAEVAPSSWDRWWWSYQRVVLHYARVAALRKVSMLSVGSELTSTEAQTERWRKLIRDVRKIYKGELTYTAAADSFDQIAFWDELDLVGLSINQARARSEAQLVERLSPVGERLARAASTREQGYVITEAGCGDDGDDTHALLCQRALFQSFRDDSRLQGIYVRHAAEDDEGAQSSARSAAEVVRHWYRKSKS